MSDNAPAPATGRNAPRRKIVSASFDDSGNAILRIWHAPDAAGAQVVAETLTVSPDDIAPSLTRTLALRGYLDAFSNIYNRLPTPFADDVLAAHATFHAAIAAGTWTPGRAPGEVEPDDIVVALATVTGQPVDVIQARIDALLAEPQLTPDGSPKLDRRGRTLHVRTQARFYAELENSDPRVKRALAAIIADRAKRLAAEAREHRGEHSTALADMFGAPSSGSAAAD